MRYVVGFLFVLSTHPDNTYARRVDHMPYTRDIRNEYIPTIIFYIFILGDSYLPLYYIYLAKVGREG